MREPGDGLAVARQHGLEGFDVGSSGFGLDDGRHAIEAVHDLRVHRLLDPQRAVLVERGDALCGRNEFGLAGRRRRVRRTRRSPVLAAPSFHEGRGSAGCAPTLQEMASSNEAAMWRTPRKAGFIFCSSPPGATRAYRTTRGVWSAEVGRGREMPACRKLAAADGACPAASGRDGSSFAPETIANPPTTVTRAAPLSASPAVSGMSAVRRAGHCTGSAGCTARAGARPRAGLCPGRFRRDAGFSPARPPRDPWPAGVAEDRDVRARHAPGRAHPELHVQHPLINHVAAVVRRRSSTPA